MRVIVNLANSVSVSAPKFAEFLNLFHVHMWPKKALDFYQKSGQMLINDKRKREGVRIDALKT